MPLFWYHYKQFQNSSVFLHLSALDCLVRQLTCLVIVGSVPSKPNKTGTFGTFFGRNFLHWSKFKNTISIFFQRCMGNIFTIEAVLRSQHIESSDAIWEFSACEVHKKDLGAFTRFLHLKTKLFAMKFRCVSWVIQLQSLQKCFGLIFTIFACKNEAACREIQTHFGGLHFASKKKSSWRIFLICASKYEGISREVQMHLGRSLLQVLQKSSGHNFTSCASKNEAVCHEIQTHFGSSLPASFTEKVVGAVPRFVRPRMKLFAVKFRRISKVFCLQGLQEKLWVQLHDLCVQKCSGLLWSSDAFWKFLRCKLYKKVVGAFSRFMRRKMKLFAVEVRRILEVLCLQVLQKKFWVHLHDLCVQKRSCLLWNSDAFWKFSACEFYRKSYRWNSTIYVCKNEPVCCEIKTHLESFRLSSFIKNIVGAFSRSMRPKMKLFAIELRRILEVLWLWVLQKKLWVQFHDLCVQKQCCLLWNPDTFWKFSACKIYWKSCGCNSTICAFKNKAVCCEIQTHLEVLCLQYLQKKLWVQFHDLCVQKRSCFLWNSDAFWKFSACKFYRKVLGAIPRFLC